MVILKTFFETLKLRFSVVRKVDDFPEDEPEEEGGFLSKPWAWPVIIASGALLVGAIVLAFALSHSSNSSCPEGKVLIFFTFFFFSEQLFFLDSCGDERVKNHQARLAHGVETACETSGGNKYLEKNTCKTCDTTGVEAECETSGGSSSFITARIHQFFFSEQTAAGFVRSFFT